MGATASILLEWVMQKLKSHPSEPAPIPNHIINNVVNVSLTLEKSKQQQQRGNGTQTSKRLKIEQIEKELVRTQNKLGKLKEEKELGRDFPAQEHWRKEHNESLQQKREYIKEMALTKHNLDFVNCYNLAITGQSGAGKSTLINCLRNIDLNDPQAAKVGFTECTKEIKKYLYPNLEHVVLWDIPGAGTMDHPASTYFDDKMLYAFDFLIILFTERFKEIEADLIKKASECNIPVACVRNKANNDLQASRKEQKFKGLSHDEEKVALIKMMKKDILDCLGKCNLVQMPKVFIINSWAFQGGADAEPTFEEAQLLEYMVTAAVGRRKKVEEHLQHIKSEPSTIYCPIFYF